MQVAMTVEVFFGICQIVDSAIIYAPAERMLSLGTSAKSWTHAFKFGRIESLDRQAPS